MSLCNNCGAEIKEGRKFCGKCGKRVETEEKKDTANNEQARNLEDKQENVGKILTEQENKQSSSNNTAETGVAEELKEDTVDTDKIQAIDEKKKASLWAFLKRHYIKLSVSLLVLIALIVGLVFAAPYISNSFSRLFMSSEDYFKHVVKANLKEDVKGISSLLTEIKETALLDDKNATASVKIKTDEGLEALLNGFGVSNVYDKIKWIQEAELNVDVTSKDKVVSTYLALSLNEQEIGAFESIQDGKKNYISFPGINDEYMMSVLEENPYETQEFKTMSAIISAIPDEKVLSRIMNRYIGLMVDNVGKVHEKQTTVKAGSISQKCIELSTDITSNVFEKARKDVLENLKNDKDIENIIKKYCEESDNGLNYDDVYGDYVDSLDRELKEAGWFSDENSSIKLNIYVNNRGEIIGWGIKGETKEIESVFTLKGREFGYVLNFKSTDFEDISFEGNGKVQGNKLSGQFQLSAEGINIAAIDIKELDIKKSEQGYFVGKIELEVKKSIKELSIFADIPDVVTDLKIVITSETASRDKSDMRISVYNNDKLCATVNVDATLSEAEDIEIPKDAFDSQNQYEVTKWQQSFNVIRLITNLTKAGMPVEFLMMFKDAVM